MDDLASSSIVKEFSWCYVTIGDIRISVSGKSLIISLDGRSGTCLVSEIKALLYGSVEKIPIKTSVLIQD